MRMAAPWKDPQSGVWHLRQRTPRDLFVRLNKSAVNLPVGDGRFATVTIGQLVKVSLRTKDVRIAKQRHAIAHAALQAVWEQSRSSPALPILEAVSSKQAPSISAPPPGPAGGMSWETAVGRFGSGTGTLLTNMGVRPTDANHAAIISATANIMDEAFGGLHRDKFGQDPLVLQEPIPRLAVRPSMGATADPSSEPTVTIAELWSRFRSYHDDKLAASTLHRYAASISRLTAYLPNRDVRSLTADDVHSWATHRRDVEGIHPKTVNSNDLVAISSVFRWAMKREGGRVLTENPAKGECLDVPRHSQRRERTFRDAEIEAILRAALAVAPAHARDVNAQARRWCPWLAAYSGARISELTRLTAEDIRYEQGVLIMQFGYTKTSVTRSVPIHEHLIAQGFPDFVKTIGSGPLFYDPSKHALDARTPAYEIRSRKVANWVRKTAKLDIQVDPNHGWRHTFKSRALGLMDERIRDAIVGHKPGSVARRYETPSIIQMAEALKEFPRYTCQNNPT